jgi:hypothetical protein
VSDFYPQSIFIREVGDNETKVVEDCFQIGFWPGLFVFFCLGLTANLS